MDWYFDLSLGLLVTVPGGKGVLRQWQTKRGDGGKQRIQFWRNEEPLAALEVGDVITMLLKEDFTGEVLAIAQGGDWTAGTGDDEGWYVAWFSTNTDEITAVLAGAASVRLLGEITVTDADERQTSSQTIDVVLRNDVHQGDEGTPTEIPDASTWLSARAVRHDVVMGLAVAAVYRALENLRLMGDDDAGVRLVDNGSAGNSLDLALWNQDQAKFQVVRLGGGAGAEYLVVSEVIP